MSLMMECIECGKIISTGQSSYFADRGESPDMLDTAHIVGNLTGYDGTMSGSNITLTKHQIICGECLKRGLPNMAKYLNEVQ